MDLTGRNFGKYKLVESLGHGGMAEVYKAHQPGLDRFVAIKVMHSHLAKSPDFVSRFKREAKSIGQLQHSHILHVIDFDVQDKVYYIVMDYIQGDTLGDYLRQKGALPVEESLAIIAQLVDAVDYAHRQGVIHRDIKPANVMFMDDAHSHVILTDFGMARLLDDAALTISGTLIGTPAYMSPEAARGEQVDERTDVYSLGVVLYEMVTGTTPYTGDTPVAIILKQASEPLPSPRKFKPDLPELVELLLVKALAKDRSDRFQSAAEFKEAIVQAQISLEEDQTISSTLPADRTRTAVRRPTLTKNETGAAGFRPRILLAAGGGVLLVALLALVWFTFGRQSNIEDTGPVVASAATSPSTERPTPEQVVGEGLPPVGTLRFADNETVRAGDFILQMDGVSSPPTGSHYELWLTDGNSAKVLKLVAPLIVNNGRVNFEGSTDQNLLANYSRIIVSLEPDDGPDPGMSDKIAFAGMLPEEFLVHMRQVTFEDPANRKGFLPGAEEQLLIAIDHAGFAQEALAANDLNQARRHAEHVVNILEGKNGPHYGDLDGDGLAQNPGDGFGVLPYLEGAMEQVQLAAEIAPATAGMQQAAGRLRNTGDNHLNLLNAALEKALQIFAADTVTEAQPFADKLAELLNQVQNGTDLDGNGTIDPTKNEGGMVTLYEDSLLMAEIAIFPKE